MALVAAGAATDDAGLLEFWQLLLAAELPAGKSRALLESMKGKLTRSELLSRLSETERQKAMLANSGALRTAAEEGVWALAADDYPEVLRQTPGAPSALFVWGDASPLEKPTVAIVGTRQATPYGRAVAIKFAEGLARAGVTIVSGGALGVDAAAHRGALQAGGSTVAILAGGVDRLYPPNNRGLFEQIRKSGCLISQYAIGTRPDRFRFLERNGLIAALSRAVVVIEAPSRSGSLRTAHQANDLGRQVFVVPGTVDMDTFRGSHALIRDGASLVDHPDQVLEELGLSAATPSAPSKPASSAGSAILEHLSWTALSPEKLAEICGMEAADVMSELTMLEIDGHAVRTDGGYVKSL